MKPKLIDIFGWYGMVAVLLAYGLVSFGLLHTGYWYLFLNGSGSLGLLLEAYSKKDSPVTVLNAVWLVIALIGLVKLFA